MGLKPVSIYSPTQAERPSISNRRLLSGGTRAVSFGSFSFPVKENEQTENNTPRIDRTSPDSSSDEADLDPNQF
jgi:hypothetical protein